jgi:hypothetical protein
MNCAINKYSRIRQHDRAQLYYLNAYASILCFMVIAAAQHRRRRRLRSAGAPPPPMVKRPNTAAETYIVGADVCS